MSDRKRKLKNTKYSNIFFFKKNKESSENEPNTSNSETPIKNNKEENPVSKLSLNDSDITNYFKQTRMSDELNLSMFK